MLLRHDVGFASFGRFGREWRRREHREFSTRGEKSSYAADGDLQGNVDASESDIPRRGKFYVRKVNAKGRVLNLRIFSQAYVAICDLLIVFCNQLSSNPYKVLDELVYEPDKELQKMLNDFIQGNVFVYEEGTRLSSKW